MFEIEIDLSGIEEIKKQLQESVDEVFQGAIDGIHAVSLEMAEQAKDAAPVDTGDLRSSTHISDTVLDGDEITGGIYNNSEYAVYVEFGTGDVGRDTAVEGKSPEKVRYHTGAWCAPMGHIGIRWTRGQPARPFMYPALMHGKKIASERISKAILERFKG